MRNLTKEEWRGIAIFLLLFIIGLFLYEPGQRADIEEGSTIHGGIIEY